MRITSVQYIVISTKEPSSATAPFDSCPSRVLINKIYNLIPHSGSRIVHRDGFSL